MLHLAASLGCTAVVSALADLQRLAQPDYYGRTPLHYAAKYGQAAVVQQLLRAAPQTASATDHDGWLPLHFAAREGFAGVVMQLLQTAPDTVETAHKKGALPIHHAADQGHAEVCSSCWRQRH
jgi:ankyrin repeat protein